MGEGILLIIYGSLVEAGGIIGFLKAKSRPSLISGLASGVVLTISGIAALLGATTGSYVGLFVTVLVCALFSWRFARTKAMMPSGMMLFVSIAVAVVLAVLIFQPLH